MKKRRILFFTISLFGTLVVFLPSLLRPLRPVVSPPQPPAEVTPAEPKEEPKAAAIFTKDGDALEASPTPPLRFTSQSSGLERSFALAMDEGVERDPTGRDRPVRIDPPATPSTLARRLSGSGTAHPVFPVCYEEGKPHTEEYRLIITSEITVQLADKNQAPTLPEGLRVTEQPAYAPGFLVISARDPFAAIAALDSVRAVTGVEGAEIQLAAQRQKKALPNDPFIGDQWHLKASGSAQTGSDINVENAWRYGSTGGVRGNGIRIGIVDDGLQTGHPDLAANVDTANDFDWNGNDASPEPGIGDDHGTACAGNAAAVGNNSLGVSGSAPEATLVGMRLIAASTTDSQEAQALAYLPNLIEIKSNSWGPDDTGTSLDPPGSLARAALANSAATGRNGLGTIFVWAGGNGGDIDDNSNYDGYANDIHTIAVGASNSLGRQSFYSEPGANLVVVAPSSGEGSALGITTTDLTGAPGYNESGDYTDDFGGTSSSTPTVAGVVALMLERNPNLGWRDVQEILLSSARQIDPSDSDWTSNAAGQQFNHKYGAGLVDATAAVALAEGWSKLASVTSQTISQNNLSLQIPDNNATGLIRSLPLTGVNLRTEQVTLTVSISHQNRGDLAITLVSPTGMESRLAEVRPDSGNNYSSWTFSSVRHWGENSQGVWTVRIADRAAGTTGTLTSLSLTVHGAVGVPINPSPQIAITSPTSGATFSPNSALAVTVSASDLAADGSPGTVATVELFDNGISQGVLTAAPFTFALTPRPGSHSLTAIATDSEGKSTTSGAVNFAVVDQAPTVTAATLSPLGQAFSDEEIAVTGVAANDPEGANLSYSYRWQSSPDGVTWTDTALTSATLSAGPARAGLLWRCAVTATDSSNVSAPFFTEATNSLARPPLLATVGQSLSYLPGLVLRGSESTLARDAIINEFSQGTSGASEWVEILVLRETSLRNWELGDSNGTPLEFADTAGWESIPAGTLLVIYNGASRDSLLPADNFDVGSGALVIASDNESYFSGGWPGYGNGGDGVILRDATGDVVAGFSYGSNSTFEPRLGAVNSGKSAYFAGDDEAEASSARAWSITDSTVARRARALRVAASLPLSYGGSWSSLPDSFTRSGTGTYGSSLGTDNEPGSARFDDSGDTLGIEIEQAAGSVSYQLRANTSGASTPSQGTFIVEESADGVAYSPLRTIVNQDTSDTAYRDTPATTTRFLQFRYDDKVSGNLQFDQLVITAGSGGGPGNLGLTIAPASFSEGAGASAASGSVSIAASLPQDLVVTLTSSDTTAATIPGTVTIPTGQTSVTFAVAAVDDGDSDGAQFATITASATGSGAGTFDLTITDDEPSLEGVTPAAGNNPANAAFMADLASGAFNSPALFRLAAGSSLPAGLALDEATGLISGTIANAATLGSYPITIERTNTFSEVRSLSFTLEVEAGEGGYLAWIAVEGVSAMGANDDPDGDGLANVMEYYLAGSARVADPTIAPALASVDGSAIKITYWRLKSATEVTGTIEWSDTLAPTSWSTAGVSYQVLAEEPTREFMEATLPASLLGKRFARLRVE